MERVCLWREVLYRPKPYLKVSTWLDYRAWNHAGLGKVEWSQVTI
jgi:hypothetical protein